MNALRFNDGALWRARFIAAGVLVPGESHPATLLKRPPAKVLRLTPEDRAIAHAHTRRWRERGCPVEDMRDGS